MSGEFTEFFTELFYGSGSWLGLIILIILCLGMLLKWKYSGALFLPIMLFLGIDYLSHNLGWNALIMFFSSVFTVLYMVKGYRKE